MPCDISVCIATYFRPHELQRLLLSLQNQKINLPFTYEIIVVDNDAQGSAKPVVEKFTASNILLQYAIEPRQNIAHARNKALELANGTWLAFIDDDEEAHTDWLNNFWRKQQKISATGFFGPVLPRFESTVQHGFLNPEFYQRPCPVDGINLDFKQTRTSNAFLRRDSLLHYKFDADFGRLGGSDVELFARMQRDGHRFVWCADARVTEYFPQERVNQNWLLRRAFRGGLSFTKLRLKQQNHLLFRLQIAFKSIAGILFFALLLPFQLFRGQLFLLRNLQKLLVQIGHFCGTLNINFVAYKRRSTAIRIKFIFNVCTHYRRKLFEQLAQKYDIEFLFFSAGDENYYDGRGSKSLGNFSGRYLKGWNLLPHLRLTPGLLPALWGKKADLIIKCINGPLPLLLAFSIAKLRSIPFILWTGVWHDLQTPFHKIARPVVDFIYRHAAAIVTYGDHVTRYLCDRGVDHQKIFPAYQAHDTTDFLVEITAAELAGLRRELAIETSRVALYVGRLVPEKGLATLMQAFAALDQREVTLLIIGAGEMEAMLRAQFHEKVNGHLLPYIENAALAKYYALADIFILPSITTPAFREPWGFVVNEAMCQSCAIVVSDAVGAGQGGLIQSGVNGVIFPEGDAEALQSVINKLLHDQTFRLKLQHNALQTIKNWPLEKCLAGFDAAIKFSLNQKQENH